MFELVLNVALSTNKLKLLIFVLLVAVLFVYETH